MNDSPAGMEGSVLSLFDHMFEGIQIVGFDWRYLYLNESAVSHARRPREELIGRTMTEMYPGIETTEVFARMRRCMTERVPQQMVNRFTYPDGHVGWFDLRISPVPMGTLILTVDITAHKATEEQLHRVQKIDAIGRLAGGVAHDFNNLLTVIAGYSEMLLKEVPAGSPWREPIQEIRRAGERAESLTRQLLAFGRKQVLQPELLDLNAVVEGMGKMLRRVIGEDIELSIRPAPRPGSVFADPGQIEQIILNLALNARDAMPRGGRLTIETADAELDEEYARTHAGARAGPHVLLSITDTGIGMDAETKARIFEPFFTTKGPGKGTGLGLATVYGIVRQSEGNIWVYSEPGRGTTFRVYLPRAERGITTDRPRPTKPAPPPGQGTILVVEDEPGVRGLIRRVLETGGYTVLDGGDVDDAVRICRDHGADIHLLLTDVVLPKMNGRELAARVLSIRPGLKVVYMSGFSDDVIAHHGMLDPGSAFLPKPITPDALLTRLAEVLREGDSPTSP